MIILRLTCILSCLLELAHRHYYMRCMSTAMIWQTYSTNSAETERLGELLGSKLSGGEVIDLRSDLGGGKTTFVKGLARGAGSHTNVASPTFTLSRIYPAKSFDIHHFDFYRLKDPGILADQLSESINNRKAVVVVEWANIVDNVLPKERISIEFKPTPNHPDEREVIIKYPEPNRRLIAQLETEWQEGRP
jgi:tRNA threonylcarbamoyladenosine biosynthesis protein TsaE